MLGPVSPADNPWFGALNRRFALAYLLALVAATVVTLAFFGRHAWCSLGDWSLWTFDAHSAHLSQHIIDPYSFTHIEHGVLFFAGLWLFARKKPLAWRLLAALTLAAGWEVLENSSWIIDKYREQTVDAGYYGDSIANALADMACAAFGFWFSSKFRWWWSVGLIVVFEVGLALTIRDNLLLNIIMLIYPLDLILEWQKARL